MYNLRGFRKIENIFKRIRNKDFDLNQVNLMQYFKNKLLQ